MPARRNDDEEVVVEAIPLVDEPGRRDATRNATRNATRDARRRARRSGR